MRQKPHVSPDGTRAYLGFAGSLETLCATHMFAALRISASRRRTHASTNMSVAPCFTTLTMNAFTEPYVAWGSRSDSATAAYFPGASCALRTAS